MKKKGEQTGGPHASFLASGSVIRWRRQNERTAQQIRSRWDWDEWEKRERCGRLSPGKHNIPGLHPTQAAAKKEDAPLPVQRAVGVSNAKRGLSKRDSFCWEEGPRRALKTISPAGASFSPHTPATPARAVSALHNPAPS